jgi:hypothetical protein
MRQAPDAKRANPVAGILAARFEDRKAHAAEFWHMITHLFGRISHSADQPSQIRFKLRMVTGVVTRQQVKRWSANDGETAHADFYARDAT